MIAEGLSFTACPQCSHSGRTSRNETLRPAWSLTVAVSGATPCQTDALITQSRQAQLSPATPGTDDQGLVSGTASSDKKMITTNPEGKRIHEELQPGPASPNSPEPGTG